MQGSGPETPSESNSELSYSFTIFIILQIHG